jgi:hypothetical protein
MLALRDVRVASRFFKIERAFRFTLSAEPPAAEVY